MIRRHFRAKQNKVLLGITILGLIIISFAFLYYAVPNFHIKPCSTDSAQQKFDAANCGDADIGGVGFVLLGVPIFLFGLVALCISIAQDKFSKNQQTGFSFWRLLKTIGLTIVALFALLFTVGAMLGP
ncbi:MAG: hypothetical protein AAB436_01840 [Patescibacteria group bacterium]